VGAILLPHCHVVKVRGARSSVADQEFKGRIAVSGCLRVATFGVSATFPVSLYQPYFMI
jgi:hypothetical protein